MQHSADWVIAYHGGGQVHFGAEGLRFKPQISKTADETHAALILSKKNHLQYFEIDLAYVNLQALRWGLANPWESFWLFFNYKPQGPFKQTNYLALKTNGIEIGRATGDRDQVILKTWDESASPYGLLNRLRMKRLGTRIEVQVNENPVLIYTFAGSKEKLLTQPGSIGLYTEDAEVLVKSVQLRTL